MATKQKRSTTKILAAARAIIDAARAIIDAAHRLEVTFAKSVETENGPARESLDTINGNAWEILTLAQRSDARTGKADPSKRKPSGGKQSAQ